MRLWLRLLFIALLAYSAVGRCADVQVTIAPLKRIVAPLLEGVAQVDALVRPGVSPHHYALKPSDIQKLTKADVFIWFGPELEPFFVKTLQRLSSDKILQLSTMANVHWRYYGANQHHIHEHDEGPDQEHDEHLDDENEGKKIDPHFWLSPKQVGEVAAQLCLEFIRLWPEHKQRLIDNHRKFSQELAQLSLQAHQQLDTLKSLPFISYHRSLDYFVAEFQLNQVGVLAGNIERNLSGKKMLAVRSMIADQQVRCLLSEPEFAEMNLSKLLPAENGKIVELDILGAKASESAGYADLFRQVVGSVADCLTE